METNFLDLLQRAEKLSNAIGDRPLDPSATIPKVQKSLDEIFQQGERLWKKSAIDPSENREFADQSALTVDSSLILNERKAVPNSREISNVLPVAETDLERFLQSQRETVLMSLIDETVARSTESLEKRQRECASKFWEQRKQKLLTEVPAAILNDCGSKAQTAPATDSFGKRTAMTEVELMFSKEVNAFTEKILQSGSHPKLVDLFSNSVQACRDTTHSVIWEQTKCMLATPTASGRTVLQQRLSQPYKTESIANALGWLEDQFRKHMEAIVYGNITQAALRGVPGIYALVHAYLNVIYPIRDDTVEDILIENHPVWAVIFFCLRSGDLAAAITAAEAAGPQLNEFTAALKEMQRHNGQISSETKTKLNLIYLRGNLRTSQDHFKKASFIVIACETCAEDIPEILKTLQDWLWFRLRQVQLYESMQEPSSVKNNASERASLAYLQKQILEDFGERHFASGDTPFLFWSALWLTGQYEAAIDYLYRQSRVLRCHAVHVALAANQLGLLVTPTNVQAKLCAAQPDDSQPIRRLNFVRLILMYTSSFQNSDPKEAVNYLYFLKSFQSFKGDNMFCVALSDLVLETKEYTTLLGSIGPDGTRKPGVVNKFGYESQRLIEFTARQCEQQGSTETATVLYDLAENHTKVLELLNDLLTKIAEETSETSLTRSRIVDTALSIAQRYRTSNCNADIGTATTFYLLMDIVTFFDLYHSKRYKEAIDVIPNLDLFPLRMADVDRHVKKFHGFAEQITRLFPQLLLALMDMIFAEYRRLKGHMGFTSTTDSNANAIEAFKNSGRALLSYIGAIPLTMPGDTTARLVQMEVLMH